MLRTHPHYGNNYYNSLHFYLHSNAELNIQCSKEAF